MTPARISYEARFTDLVPTDPDLGTVALVPWDTEIFDFPVARFSPAVPQLAPAAAARCRRALAQWTDQHAIRLWICDIPASHVFWKKYLPRLGFQSADVALRATLSNLQRAALPESRCELRPATPDDHDAIEQIAATGFQHGRYHADPTFPRRLADKRYQQWIARALSNADPSERVYVLVQPGKVAGFYHVKIENDGSADLRLASLRPELQGTMLGLDLYSSMLQVLANLGVRRVSTKISALNTGVLNVYSMLGFHFGSPELLFHRHTPGAAR
jgi:L-amino acid N-acyltransferase YncA